MARRPSVRYFPSRGAYYCQMNGKQYKLAVGPDDFPHGPTYKKAAKEYGRLACGQARESEPAQTKLGVVLAQYLIHIEGHKRPKTARIRKQALAPLADKLGELAVSELRHHHAYAFIATMRKPRKDPTKDRIYRWGDGQVRNFLASLQAALNWACKPGVALIADNPMRGIETPAKRSRGAESLVSPETHRSFLAQSREYVRNVLVCLEATGMRPGELVAAEAKHWDEGLGALVYRADEIRREGEFGHKTSKKKTRIIFFTGEALAVIRALVRKHPTGPLFRNSHGKRWSINALDFQFQGFRESEGIDGLTPYSYRHTFATNWLLNGGTIDSLAAVLGNSPAIIRQHYSHLLAHGDKLREEIERIRATQRPPDNQEPRFRAIG